MLAAQDSSSSQECWRVERKSAASHVETANSHGIRALVWIGRMCVQAFSRGEAQRSSCGDPTSLCIRHTHDPSWLKPRADNRNQAYAGDGDVLHALPSQDVNRDINQATSNLSLAR